MGIPSIFVDGEHGTTGLQIVERLASRKDVQLLSIPHEQRHSAPLRKEFLNRADVVILCLPDEAAREAVSWIENPAVKVIDASTAHRVHPDWVFGFPEMARGQRERIVASSRVANPGCYSTGAIALLRPLIESGALAAESAVNILGVSGYTGGGKALIGAHEGSDPEPFAFYALGLAHKHVPEVLQNAGLRVKPVFLPSVGHFPTGMLVSIPLHASQLSVGAERIAQIFADWYAGERFIQVAPLNDQAHLVRGAFLRADSLSGTNNLEIFVYASTSGEELVVMARLDNLGKGASGAAVQNLNLLLGLPEARGLE
ncbi:Acetylglutamate semialdehyde dehydrogenase [gamma proteobacterium HdN1]|nr:Acetylglutamate semialdehyde dehydrogenase [gamma proteobacterium HdN1]